MNANHSVVSNTRQTLQLSS